MKMKHIPLLLVLLVPVLCGCTSVHKEGPVSSATTMPATTHEPSVAASAGPQSRHDPGEELDHFETVEKLINSQKKCKGEPVDLAEGWCYLEPWTGKTYGFNHGKLCRINIHTTDDYETVVADLTVRYGKPTLSEHEDGLDRTTQWHIVNGRVETPAELYERMLDRTEEKIGGFNVSAEELRLPNGTVSTEISAGLSGDQSKSNANF
jgi:hypothetical protein